MTIALEKASLKAAHLPKSAQDQLAAQLLEEIAAELKLNKPLPDSQVLLERLASDARKAIA
jgi:hypothetical protein